MKLKNLFTLFFLSISFSFFGQTQKEVLFTVDGDPVYVETFKRMYLKNQDLIEGKSKTNLEDYLDLYIDYNLKIKEAKAQKLNEKASFLNEFNKYRAQLSQKYITESEVTEELVREAYDRLKTAVNASHILIAVNPNASPEDTLKAYNRVLEIRKEILNGKPFSKAAGEYSDDTSAQKNGGDLGWFRVFKMVYPFETAAYNTKIGEISMPIRTQFGYHLIKVNDKRPALGKVKVAHIMLFENGSDSVPEPEKLIFDLYNQLKNGADFTSLAKKYSEDKNSAANGGELNWFEPSDLLVKNFGEVAFSLKNPGDISEPFQTKFGWHIVKLIEKKPVGDLEENKAELEKKIKNDSRAHLISDSMFRELREKYNIKKNQKVLDFFHSFVTDSILNNTWKLDTTSLPQKNSVEIGNEAKTYSDFAKYINRRQKAPHAFKDKNKLIDQWYHDFVNNTVLDYHRAHLEESNPEFAAIAKEYYNGLLLFDLMEQQIWAPAKKDSLELKKYFKKNHKKYDSDKLEDVRGTVQNDYQKYLEDRMMKGLRKKYDVEINQENWEKLKADFEKTK
ncbi:MAG TPA: peptidylprolyl isomerase [Flavobacteriaceae bacterium]|nr:peptidylprolyl isomerase [Flavobacteriaceae bacterium]